MLRVLGRPEAGQAGLLAGSGVASLVLFAWLLTLVEAAFAGRAYAAYGGIYVAASLGWLWAIEGTRPDRWDITGALICVIGAGIILFGPRSLPA